MKTRVIVSAIVLNKNGEILLMERYKPDVSPAYLGLLEIPAGGVDEFEDVYKAVRREVKEETNLDVTIIDGEPTDDTAESFNGDIVNVFKPFCGQQTLRAKNGLHWIGFVFVCYATGELKLNPTECRNPQWIRPQQLKEQLEQHEDNFFPLQYKALVEYVGSLANKA